MYRRILVPLDATPFGDYALPTAVSIALRTGASLELVHVHQRHEIEPGLAAMPQYRFEHIERLEQRNDEEEVRAARSWLEERAADIEIRHDINVTTRLLIGRTPEVVREEAGNIVADLIVLSTHARRGMQRLRFGDLAHELISHLNVPALCIRPADSGQPVAVPDIRNVLVALDGSEFSEQILDPIGPLLTALGAVPTLLHVVTSRLLTLGGLDDIQRTIPHQQEALVYLNEVAERHQQRIPRPLLSAMEAAEPADAIAQVLAEGEFDMVALATHGRSGLSRLVLGSVAEDVVTRVNVPVLLYRPRSARLPRELSTTFTGRGE